MDSPLSSRRTSHLACQTEQCRVGYPHANDKPSTNHSSPPHAIASLARCNLLSSENHSSSHTLLPSPPSVMNALGFVSSFTGTALLPSHTRHATSPVCPRAAPLRMGAGQLREIRDRISSVKNTQKITDAMRLVAAAKVRRAQDAVLRTRPFSETLQQVLGNLIKRLNTDYTDLPLLAQREAKKVLLVVISGDRGLCGGYNSYVIKKAQVRAEELTKTGIDVELVTIGNKGQTFFKNRAPTIRRHFQCTQAPTAEQASEISDELLAEYLSGDVDRVELVYTRFVSLIASEASVRTMLPLSPQGIESDEDEIFQLTTEDGKLGVKVETVQNAEAPAFPPDMIFEQDPLQILNAILPLYLNGQILRALQESVASELAARMSAMSNASDNAKELSKDLSLTYNRGRQAAITQEISEIVAGAMDA
ncbi:unnamed protein product [Agarophyton chilense]|eukprot:gb/GEZJ01002325.1/.p2 GENE.gb/GEZJ01002325.1/~~gb/GEZJ01002325.1/.p2  ORF type:complete len:421 (-),score=65.46 gb/GEZJ01002325.1/:4386-5648(-)